MDRFFVGQRVRVRGNRAPGRLIAKVTDLQGRIVPGEWVVEPEQAGHVRLRDLRGRFLANVADLETLPPQGMAPVEWDDCAWRPDEVPELVRIPRRTCAPRPPQRALRRRPGD